MGLTGDTTRDTWVGRGDKNLSRTEWEGVIAWMDRHNLFLKVDGRGNAHMRDVPGEEWWFMVCDMVAGSR